MDNQKQNQMKQKGSSKDGLAITSFVFGLISLLLSILFIPQLVSIITGIFGLKSNKKGFAIAGIVISLCSLVTAGLLYAIAIPNILNAVDEARAKAAEYETVAEATDTKTERVVVDDEIEVEVEVKVDEAEETPKKELVEKDTDTINEKDSDGAVSSIGRLKEKHGETDKDIMPLYNVDPAEQFVFNFKADVGLVKDLISVHTDSRCLPESEVVTSVMSSLAINAKDPGEVTVSPGGFPVLENPNELTDGLTWGNAPIYYIRINYDLDATELLLLEEPIIIPFTIQSEVEVPTLRYTMENSRVAAVWSPIEGATEYKIYRGMGISNLLDDTNKPVNGAEMGYSGVYLSEIGTTTDTFFQDFYNADYEKGSISTIGGMIRFQNYGVAGDYYISAVVDGKESRLSNALSTSKLDLPVTSEISYEKVLTIEDIPTKVVVTMATDEERLYSVTYDYDREYEFNAFGNIDLFYEVVGTNLQGKVFCKLGDMTEEDLEKLDEKLKEINDVATNSARQGTITVKDTTESAPPTDLPTIINERTLDDKEDSDHKNEDGLEGSSITVEEQAENTKEVVEAANETTFEIVDAYYINADTAFEEYLANELISAKETISVKAFPKMQQTDVMADTFMKVVYQNPYILGVSGLGYDYNTMELLVEYDFTSEEIISRQAEIKEELDRIIDSLGISQSSSAKEKASAIYLYLEDNVVYDTAALENAEANNFKEVDERFDDSFTTYGIVVNKVGVCMSYSYAYKLLADTVGLETIVVTGDMKGVPHAWNKVLIEGEWLTMDATNNYTTTGMPYLMYLADDEIATDMGWYSDKAFCLDHKATDYLSDNESHEYYIDNDLVIDSVGELYNALMFIHDNWDYGGLSLVKLGNPDMDEEDLLKEVARFADDTHIDVDNLLYKVTDEHLLLLAE